MALPSPEPGLVVSYAYLWHGEHRVGRDEGRKDRPCVIVLAVETKGSATSVVVLPITHSAPDEPSAGVEIPPAVKAHLGLDAARSWIIVSEGNEFEWPGFDLRSRAASRRYDFGFLPPRFFAKVVAAFVTWHRRHKVRLAPR